MLNRAYYSQNRSVCLSSPLGHITMAWCLLFSACHVSNMSHLGQRGRGWFPPTGPIEISCTWRCVKWTRSALRIEALPGNPPPGKLCDGLSVGRIPVRYWAHPGGGGGVPQISPGHPVLEPLPESLLVGVLLIIGFKGYFHAQPRLLLPKPLSLPLFTPRAHHHGLVFTVQRLPCVKHVTLGTARERVVPSYRTNRNFLHVAVCKVDSECAPD